MARKHVALMILTIMSSSILAGCINNDNDEENTPSDNDEPVNSMIYISSGSQAPDCQNSNLGTMIYVEDEKQFQYCSSSGWTVLEIDLPNGANGSNGTNGTNGVDGADGA